MNFECHVTEILISDPTQEELGVPVVFTRGFIQELKVDDTEKKIISYF